MKGKKVQEKWNDKKIPKRADRTQIADNRCERGTEDDTGQE